MMCLSFTMFFLSAAILAFPSCQGRFHYCHAFSPSIPFSHHCATQTEASSSPSRQRSMLLLKKGKKKKNQSNSPPKLSYAERLLHLRQEKAKDFEQLSTSTLSSIPVTDVSLGQQQEKEQQRYQVQRAKLLVDAQRKSVDMLTFVRERVEGLPRTPIEEGLQQEGYVVVDDFLANNDVMATLQAEGSVLLDNELMSTDLTRLGSGEYVCPIKGGEDQYVWCPRTIEMVVSMTKHLPQQGLLAYNLDGTNCMATMRTFDRNSRLASLSLLHQDDDGESFPPLPFDIVAKDDAHDARKVTLLYYLVDATWTDYGGGGIVVEQGERLVSAKRDRLILLRSDSCWHRPEYFVGSDTMPRASCLELHLIHKSTKEKI